MIGLIALTLFLSTLLVILFYVLFNQSKECCSGSIKHTSQDDTFEEVASKTIYEERVPTEKDMFPFGTEWVADTSPVSFINYVYIQTSKKMESPVWVLSKDKKDYSLILKTPFECITGDQCEALRKLLANHPDIEWEIKESLSINDLSQFPSKFFVLSLKKIMKIIKNKKKKEYGSNKSTDNGSDPLSS